MSGLAVVEFSSCVGAGWGRVPSCARTCWVTVPSCAGVGWVRGLSWARTGWGTLPSCVRAYWVRVSSCGRAAWGKVRLVRGQARVVFRLASEYTGAEIPSCAWVGWDRSLPVRQQPKRDVLQNHALHSNAHGLKISNNIIDLDFKKRSRYCLPVALSIISPSCLLTPSVSVCPTAAQ